MPDLRAATASDVDGVARILAAGFEDDPVMSWVMSGPGRLPKLESLFTHAAASFIGPGTIWWTDDIAACWLPPPGHPEEDEERALVMGAAMIEAGCTNDDLERLATMGEAMGKAHPVEPHWYLGIVATLPDRRGGGLGSAVLQHSLAAVDRDRSAAYLESSNPRNISLYERHGFEVTGLIEVPGGPPMYPMWRAPR